MTSELASQLPAMTLAVLFFAAPIAFLASARAARIISVATAFIEVVLAWSLAWMVSTSGPVRYAVGGWGAPLGIDLSINGISAAMIVITSVVGLAVTVYAASYFGRNDSYRYYWPLWLFLWGSLVALFSTNDIFNLYVCLELVTMSAVGLVGISGTKRALVAAMRYMLAALGGSLFYLLGVALIYGAVGVLDISLIAEKSLSSPAAQVGLSLAVVGLVIKTALVPLHFWLPPAHANAASPVSAVLSALVVKGSFYIILVLMIAMAGATLVPGLPFVLGIMGAVAIFWGSLQAFLQTRLKMLIAYSTVAQIGYLFVLFPLVAESKTAEQAATAISAGIFQAISHALAKGSMFLAAGVVIGRIGHDRISDLTGLARRAPALALAFGLAGVSMIGLPPSGGFVSKWLYVSAALQTGAWWWAIPILAGGLLAAAYIFKAVAVFMRSPDPASPHEASGERVGKHHHPVLTWVPLGLAIASLLVGVFGQPILDLIGPAAMALALKGTP